MILIGQPATTKPSARSAKRREQMRARRKRGRRRRARRARSRTAWPTSPRPRSASTRRARSSIGSSGGFQDRRPAKEGHLLRHSEPPGRDQNAPAASGRRPRAGKPNSSNSNRLAEIAQEGGQPAYLIDSGDEIDPQWLKECETVLVTAGARPGRSRRRMCGLSDGPL